MEPGCVSLSEGKREREETRRLYKDRHADMELTTDRKTNGEDEVFPQRKKKGHFKNSGKKD